MNLKKMSPKDAARQYGAGNDKVFSEWINSKEVRKKELMECITSLIVDGGMQPINALQVINGRLKK